MQIRFQRRHVVIRKMDLQSYRRKSRGWMNDSPAFIHPRILFGPGIFLDDEFVTKHEITHVINCAGPEDSPAWFRSRFPGQYVCLNAPDTLQSNILDWYGAFESALNQYLKDPTGKTVYIHCQCGINRSGFLAAAYACKRLGYEFEEVLKSILYQRPCALTNPSYHKQVKEYCSV